MDLKCKIIQTRWNSLQNIFNSYINRSPYGETELKMVRLSLSVKLVSNNSLQQLPIVIEQAPVIERGCESTVTNLEKHLFAYNYSKSHLTSVQKLIVNHQIEHSNNQELV